MDLNDYMDDLGFTADDLKEPEELVFTAKEPVSFYILKVNELKREATGDKKALNAIILKTKVMNGEYKDKLYSIFINKNLKYLFIPLLRAVWTVAELQKAVQEGTIDYTKLVNKTLEAVPAAANEYQGKTYQNFFDWKDVSDCDSAVEADDTEMDFS